MRHFVSWLAGAALLAPAASMAGTPWLCGLSDDALRLVCVADHDPALATAATLPATTATVNGTRFPLDPRGQWTVDLWSPPTDMDQLELLARATICYRSPGCEVRLVLPRTVARR